MTVNKREMMLGVATIGCLLCGTIWFIVDKKIPDYRAKKSEIEKLGQQISYHQNAIRMREDWREELDMLQEDLLVFDEEDRSVSSTLMKSIKSIAGKHNMDIINSKPYEEKKIGNLFELGINCNWEGSLEALVGFLAELQQQGVRYDIHTLNVSPMGKNSNKLKGNMIIHCAYTRKPATDNNS